MNKPNFLIVGAAKSGTTSIYSYLKQHPEIFIPDTKECRYFSSIGNKRKNPYTGIWHDVDVIENSKEYYNLFKETKCEVRGDVSPDYLYYYENAIKKIQSELGDKTKIIIILRNPVQRTYSNYLHILREGHTTEDISEILKKEEEWLKKDAWYGFYITKPSYYYKAVNQYLGNFENVEVIIFEDFIKDINGYLKKLCAFLEVDDSFKFEEPYFKNKTGVPKSKLKDFLLTSKYPLKREIKSILVKILGKAKYDNKITSMLENNLTKKSLSKKFQEELLELFINDINKLEAILGIDLSEWKK